MTARRLFPLASSTPAAFDGDAFGDGAQMGEADPYGFASASERVPQPDQRVGDATAGRKTMAGRVAAHFLARPNVWIDGRDLMAVAGSYGWRTRCSDIRRPPYSMTIENRQRRVGAFIVSEYRYVSATDANDGGAA